MLHPVKALNGMTLGATDGEIGKIKDIYFDDVSWGIRYLVVDTGNWLSNRKVLISPRSVQRVDWEKDVVHVSLSKEQIKNSPDIDTDKPFSREQEAEFYRYYGYPVYWGGGFLWGPYPVFDSVAETGMLSAEQPVPDRYRIQADDHHLRSADEVKGYHVRTTDSGDEGPMGHVAQFLLDDDDWAIRYLVVDTAKWFAGRHIIVRPQWASEVQWADSTVTLNVTRAAVEASPEYDPDVLTSRDYEARLHEHYQRPAYWDGE